MKHIEYKPVGVCSKNISFDIDENNNIHNLEFTGGCNGNLGAISKLVEGKNAKEIEDILRGNECGMKGTSCADQFSKAIEQALGSLN